MSEAGGSGGASASLTQQGPPGVGDTDTAGARAGIRFRFALETLLKVDRM
jgi:hypothetical protein